MKINNIIKIPNNIKAKIRVLFHYNFYQKYLFKTFAIEFLLWSVALFFVLFSLSYIDHSSIKLTSGKKISYITTKAFIDFFSIFDILNLCVCLSFFIRSQKTFNFCILNSFSIKSFAILKPIFAFISIIWFLKLFLFQPVNAIFYNSINTHIKKINGEKIVKYGDKINFLDHIDNGLFIINGIYHNKTHNEVAIKKATILKYDESHNLLNVYYVPELFLMDNKWIIKKSLMLNNLYDKKTENYNHTFTTKKTTQNALTSLSGSVKMVQNQITIYDIIIYFIKSNNTNNKDRTKLYFTEKFIFNFIELFNLFICCFLTFLCCISNNRNDNFIKQIIKSFLGFFVLIRIFHFFINEMMSSFFFCCCVLLFDIVLLCLFFTMIYEKDFNKKIIKRIRKETKKLNKKITIKTIKTIRKRRKLKH